MNGPQHQTLDPRDEQRAWEDRLPKERLPLRESFRAQLPPDRPSPEPEPAPAQEERPEFFHGLSPAQHERLTILFEECSEVIQVVGKILRHGPDSFHPRDPECETNMSKLEYELSHVMVIGHMMVAKGDLAFLSMLRHAQAKAASIGAYLHHQD